MWKLPTHLTVVFGVGCKSTRLGFLIYSRCLLIHSNLTSWVPLLAGNSDNHQPQQAISDKENTAPVGPHIPPFATSPHCPLESWLNNPAWTGEEHCYLFNTI